MKYYLQVLLAISIYMSHFDPFHSICWVFISRDTRDFDIIREADRIASKVSASLWEAASCATPDIRTGEVHIEAHCFNYVGNYKNIVIADNKKYANLFQNTQHTFNSLVFRHRALDPSTPSLTPTMEIFSDFSAKLHVPLGFASDNERETAINNLKNSGLICKEDIKICDGVDSFNCVFGLLNLIAILYDYHNIPICDMAVCFEMENSDNTVLYFGGNIFLDQAKANGLCYCSRIESKSKVIFLKDSSATDYQAVASSLAYDFFLAEFGFDPSYAGKMILQANREKYPDIEKDISLCEEESNV